MTKCVWDFQNNALWETHYHALLTDWIINLYRLPVFRIYKLHEELKF